MADVIIVDTSAIVAIRDEAYAEHRSIVDLVTSWHGRLVVSPLVAAEADYMLATCLSPRAAMDFAADIARGAYQLDLWSAADHANALAVVERHGEGRGYIGIADAATVVLADRHRTTKVMTLDQRHFRMLRPLRGPKHFTLLPYDR